jgi:hypothetical protein
MFALFHDVPYEGSEFLGVWSTLDRAITAAYEYRAAVEAGDEGDELRGVLEIFPCELDTGFTVGFLQQPFWSSAE